MPTFKLWSETNDTKYSSVFSVPPGQCAVLHAVGLGPEKLRTAPHEFKVAQILCVNRLLHGFTLAPAAEGRCDYVFDLDRVRADMLVEEAVQTCNGTWQLTMCKNIGIIAVPGTYRLELNDDTAIGGVQVYLEIFDNNQIPVQVADLYFD